MQPVVYQWTPQDKRRYVLALTPFILAAAMTLYVLSTVNYWLAAAWVGLYLLINLFQAGCCVGCPYRSRYCPAILGIYLSNFISTQIYRKRTFDQAFFERNAAAAEIVLIIFLVFPLYWFWQQGWALLLIYTALIAGHFALFMPSQCEHCSYNQTCPGGQTWARCKKIL